MFASLMMNSRLMIFEDLPNRMVRMFRMKTYPVDSDHPVSSF